MGSSWRRKPATWSRTRGVASEREELSPSVAASLLSFESAMLILLVSLWRNSPRPVFMRVWREADVWGCMACSRMSSWTSGDECGSDR